MPNASRNDNPLFCANLSLCRLPVSCLYSVSPLPQVTALFAEYREAIKWVRISLT
jgi:hypothetical protein